MAMISIRVSDAEKEWLTYMADFYGVSLSELVKDYSMTELEDEYDQLVAKVAYKRYQESGQKSLSMDQILEEFGGSDR
ncbi:MULTISPECIES: type II toxin-antitoxin system RelB family antitoxin [Levilactobacillus]|uniref:type II toxin-antitoxin system RelB family antitoxin n=1 Tax=Levilactobacillus TaxID=2767886 RepID=UPI000F73620D|nr:MULTISPECIES: DUF6290 family protein [Levilactobacillus]